MCTRGRLSVFPVAVFPSSCFYPEVIAGVGSGPFSSIGRADSCRSRNVGLGPGERKGKERRRRRREQQGLACCFAVTRSAAGRGSPALPALHHSPALLWSSIHPLHL